MVKLSIVSERDRTPNWVEPLLELANTLDLETGIDAIAGLDAFRSWVDDPAASRRSHARALELRGFVRDALERHHDGGDDDEQLRGIETIADGLPLRWTLTGEPRVTADGGAADRALVDVVWAVAMARRDGVWHRLRLCPASDCGEAFYDGSRSGTRRWCSMELCGNRAKVQAFRERHGG